METTKSPRTKIPMKKTQCEIHDNFLEGVYNGTVLSIDPGQNNLGWAVMEVPKNKNSYNSSRVLIDYGTIYGKGKNSALAASIIDGVMEIWKTHKIDIFAIEDYLRIKGKNKGGFVIPGIIYTLKYLWYKESNKDTMTVYASTWKSSLGIPPSASKPEVKDGLREFLPAKKIVEIEEEFENSGHRGQQDCIDAICIGMYVCKKIILNARLRPQGGNKIG